MDGATLSAAMHARGINIRYLGRVVQLLLEREKAVREGASTVVSSVATTTTPNGAAPTTNGQSQPPTQNGTSSTTTNGHLANLPHYMTTIALMELIARAAKHIFNPYVQVGGWVMILPGCG